MQLLNTIGKRLQWLMDQKNINRNKLAKTIGINKSVIGRLIKDETKNPQRGTLLTLSGFFGCHIDWLETGEGEPFPNQFTEEEEKEITKKALLNIEEIERDEELRASNKINLLHEKEEWTLNEMIEMTKGVLESETVYKAALSSNIRAFHKAVTEEGKVKKLEEKVTSMDERMERMEQMLVSLGATVPEKRDKEANS